MAIKCANCKGYFLADELEKRKPPRHPWRITAAGEQAIAHNLQHGGDPRPCPECGNAALVGEATHPPRDMS